MRYYYYVDQVDGLFFERTDFNEVTKDLETFKKHMAVYPLDGVMLESFEVWHEAVRLYGETPWENRTKNEIRELHKLIKETGWEDSIECLMVNGRLEFESADEALEAYRQDLVMTRAKVGLKEPKSFKERLEMIKEDLGLNEE